jgi:DNA ligase-1
MSITKPLLAATLTSTDTLSFPVWATPKVDGIRALKIDNQLVSRTFKPIRNTWINSELSKMLPKGSDGEILVKDGTFQDTTSMVMSFDKGKRCKIFYYMFDYVKDDPRRMYLDRMEDLKSCNICSDGVSVEMTVIKLIPIKINNVKELDDYEEAMLLEGFEGVMIRRGDGVYKMGRSTEKQGILLKVKRFIDSEAKIIGFNEKEKNTNEKKLNELGNYSRSSKKEGMILMDTLGSFQVCHNEFDDFEVGTGLTDEYRKNVWNNKDDFMGKMIKFKYFPIGMKNSPRHPTFLGLRDLDDM